MGIGSRPATCASCAKRLTRKSWYYRNGKYYCKQRCWETEQAKAGEEKEQAAAEAQKKAEAEKPAAAEATGAETPKA
jgi:hypothetical protein